MSDNPKFVASTHQGRVIIRRPVGEHQIDMAPSEVSKATHIVGLILAMVDQPRLPDDHISNTPFVVRMLPKRAYALERVDISGAIPFRAKEGDELIKTLNMGRDICLNEQIHGRASPAASYVPQGMAGDEPT